MALYDAGVPLLANHVAGLAMGLVTRRPIEEEQIGATSETEGRETETNAEGDKW
jgi:polyribonucleotide nucleotidyltransferase